MMSNEETDPKVVNLFKQPTEVPLVVDPSIQQALHALGSVKPEHIKNLCFVLVDSQDRTSIHLANHKNLLSVVGGMGILQQIATTAAAANMKLK